MINLIENRGDKLIKGKKKTQGITYLSPVRDVTFPRIISF